MSYDAYELGEQTGSPVHLFQFVYEEITYYYTSRPVAVTAMGQVWESRKISLGEIKSTEDLNSGELKVQFPRDDTFAAQFLTDIQNHVCSLTVWRRHEHDPDNEYTVYWKGKIVGFNVNSNQLELVGESIYISARRQGLNGKQSKTCRHAVYHRGCNLDPTDSASDALYVEGTLSSVSADGLTLTVAAAGSQADGYYLGGMVRDDDGVFRYITGHSGSTLTIARPHVGFVASDTVRLFPGCDGTRSTCKNVFNNLLNHGGFPDTPDFNPMGGGQLR